MRPRSTSCEVFASSTPTRGAEGASWKVTSAVGSFCGGSGSRGHALSGAGGGMGGATDLVSAMQRAAATGALAAVADAVGARWAEGCATGAFVVDAGSGSGGVRLHE